MLRESDRTDVERAVSNARTAFQRWSLSTPAERKPGIT